MKFLSSSIRAGAYAKSATLWIWLTAIGFVCYQLYPLLLAVEPAGWDMAGHLYIFKELLHNLSEGKVREFDFAWGGGYPAFYLYPAGAYILLAVPFLVSRGAIAALQSFDLVLFSTALLTLASFYYLGLAYFGKRVAGFTLLFGTFLLATPPEYDYLGVGLAGAFSTGLVTNFIVLPFFTLFLALLERTRQHPTKMLTFGAVLCLAFVFYIHQLTFIFALWICVCRFAIANASFRGTLIVIVAGAVVVAAPTLLPMLRHLPFASGAKIGLWGAAADPLFPLFLGLTPSRLIECVAHGFQWIPAVPTANSGGLPQVAAPFRVPLLLINFPYAGIAALACTVTGINGLLRRRDYFLPLTYLVSLIFIPRNFLAVDLPYPIHYYRFIQPIAVLQLLLSAYGLQMLYEYFKTRRSLAMLCTAFLSVAVVVNNFLAFSLTHRSWLRDSDIGPYRSYFTMNALDYPERAHAEALMQYLSDLHPDGRVAVETAEFDFRALGSPHFFSSQLPLSYGISTVPGLLAESMLSSPFINPVLAQNSESIKWGNVDLTARPELIKQPIAQQVDRLGFFGVQFIISSSATYFSALTRPGAEASVQLEKKFGPFGLFRVASPRPLAEHLTYHPFLFADVDVARFRAFAETWYLDSNLFKYPVVFTPQEFSQLSALEQSNIGGLIIEASLDPVADTARIEELSLLKKPIVVLNRNAADTTVNGVTVRSVPSFTGIAGTERLFAILHDIQPELQSIPVPVHFHDNGTVDFSAAQTTLVSATYGPDWIDADSKRTVFWATPCNILVFGEGLVRLQYGQ